MVAVSSYLLRIFSPRIITGNSRRSAALQATELDGINLLIGDRNVKRPTPVSKMFLSLLFDSGSSTFLHLNAMPSVGLSNTGGIVREPCFLGSHPSTHRYCSMRCKIFLYSSFSHLFLFACFGAGGGDFTGHGDPKKKKNSEIKY
ncbi:hypothetical protein COCNU_scaffold003260G000030 [Cocos nucifera]|nr:hypothetical protein [Cocos nucifera]